jgi:hypothetical protein
MIRKEEWRKRKVEIKELREEIPKQGRKKKEEKVQIFTQGREGGKIKKIVLIMNKAR